MDSRAFRLSFPAGTIFFEIDRAEVIDYKNEKLAKFTPQCSRRTVPADLVLDEWDKTLINHGFDTSKKTLWIVEGLTMYLSEKDVVALIHKITELSSSRSLFLCDILNRYLLESPFMVNQLNFLESLGAPWIFGTNDPEEFFGKLGWSITLTQAGEVAPNRWPFPIAPKYVPHIPRGFYSEGVLNPQKLPDLNGVEFPKS